MLFGPVDSFPWWAVVPAILCIMAIWYNFSLFHSEA